MKLDDLKQCLTDCCNDISFPVDGLPSGVWPEVADYIPTYHVWYGDEMRDFATVDEVEAATHILALCTKLVSIDKLLSEGSK